MSVTVVITNYRRAANVGRIVTALRQQTLQPRIFVWDNSPSGDFEAAGVDWIVRSSRNARCAARWWMASHVDTDFVLVHDDDLMPAHAEVLASTLDAAVKAAPYAVGAAGVVLTHRLGYWQSRHVGVRARRIHHDVRVDIVKGCYFCVPAAVLRRVGHLDLDGEDDIAVSARVGAGAARPHLVAAALAGSLMLMQEGEGARKQRPEHRAAREAARRRFFAAR